MRALIRQQAIENTAGQPVVDQLTTSLVAAVQTQGWVFRPVMRKVT
jgi:hypothetical protein